MGSSSRASLEHSRCRWALYIFHFLYNSTLSFFDLSENIKPKPPPGFAPPSVLNSQTADFLVALFQSSKLKGTIARWQHQSRTTSAERRAQGGRDRKMSPLAWRQSAGKWRLLQSDVAEQINCWFSQRRPSQSFDAVTHYVAVLISVTKDQYASKGGDCGRCVWWPHLSVQWQWRVLEAAWFLRRLNESHHACFLIILQRKPNNIMSVKGVCYFISENEYFTTVCCILLSLLQWCAPPSHLNHPSQVVPRFLRVRHMNKISLLSVNTRATYSNMSRNVAGSSPMAHRVILPPLNP